MMGRRNVRKPKAGSSNFALTERLERRMLLDASASILKDLNTDGAGVGQRVVQLDDTHVLYGANDHVHGPAFWVSDGTAAGTNFLEPTAHPNTFVVGTPLRSGN